MRTDPKYALDPPKIQLSFHYEALVIKLDKRETLLHPTSDIRAVCPECLMGNSLAMIRQSETMGCRHRGFRELP